MYLIMKYHYSHRWIFVLVALFMATGCQSKNDDSTVELEPIDIKNIELFVDFDLSGPVRPLSIEMLPQNEVAVLDDKLQEVLVFNGEGTFQRRFGGEGKGPGEFQSPQYLNKSQNYLNVIDAELHRIIQFSYSGDFVQSYSIKENPYTSTPKVKKEKTYYSSTGGKKGSLVKLTDLEDGTEKYFGEALGEQHIAGTIEKSRQTLASGEIPPLFINQVSISFDGEYLYVFLDAHSRLQKYSPEGELLWDTSIELPVNDKIFSALVERAKNTSPGVIPTLKYISNMKVVNGETFLLWTPFEGHPRKMVRVDREGNIAAIYHIPEDDPTYFDFAIDAPLENLYLMAPRMGQIFKARLPE